MEALESCAWAARGDPSTPRVVRLHRSDVGFVVSSEGCWVPNGKSKAFVLLLVTGRAVGELKLR